MGLVMKKTAPAGKRCTHLYHAAYAWMRLLPFTVYLLAGWAKWEPGGWLYTYLLSLPKYVQRELCNQHE